MRFDCHLHTPLCGHAYGEPEDFIHAALELDIQLLTVTCHIPLSDPEYGARGIRMKLSEVDAYFAWIEEARKLGEPYGIEVLRGIEAEVAPDPSIDAEMDAFLKAHSFDFVLGSLHHQLPVWQDWFEANGKLTDEAIVQAYFSELARGACSGRYHSMAHPDVIRLYGTLSRRFKPEDHKEAIQVALDQIAESGVCLEVNTSGRIKGDFIAHPDPLILDWAVERGIPLTMGSDSHAPNMIGQYFDESLDLLKQKGFKAVHYFKAGKRLAVDIDSLV